MSYRDRLALYEAIKNRIGSTAKTPGEYERRIKALAKKLKV